MKYKKCARCGLNYVTEDMELCDICRREIRGEKDPFDDISYDVCPFCEKNFLFGGEEMCASCRARRMKKRERSEEHTSELQSP